MIILKTPSQVAYIKENGLILRRIVNEAVALSTPGTSTQELDDYIEKQIREAGATPTFKGYRGFPASACISVNDVYVHGIPSKKVKIKDGDVISIDIGVTKNGCVADSCYTYMVGNVSEEHKQLIKTAYDTTMYGISLCKPGTRIHDLAKSVFQFVEATDKFTVVEGLYGHGTGKDLHEAPTVTFTYPVLKGIPNVKLAEGMVITIEPVIGYKSSNGKFKEDADKWTLRSLDGTFGAQFEHTILITSTGNEILTGDFLSLGI